MTKRETYKTIKKAISHLTDGLKAYEQCLKILKSMKTESFGIRKDLKKNL